MIFPSSHSINRCKVSKSANKTGPLITKIDSFPNISTCIPKDENPASFQIPEVNSATYAIPTIFNNVPR